ncbi:mucin-5B-like [Rhinatrema bivittatum]|uniref:mucin-5B-like n=1 Tax=Rhinatrema bivittatum TaxID=194408 RepID=UPI001126BED0|nr:mucin-5B-like [Rhinatrema bivittatum]
MGEGRGVQVAVKMLTLLTVLLQSQDFAVATPPPRMSVIPAFPSRPVVRDLNAAHNGRVCSRWGKGHLKNFDGDIFYFPGSCKYLFASHCQSNSEDFNIQIRYAMADNTSTSHDISMTISGVAIELSNNSINFDGKRVERLPYSTAGIQMEKIGSNLKIQSNKDILFMMNDDGSILLELDDKYANQTCGMCGDFNGIATYNEFMLDGKELTSVEFGNLQKLNGPTEDCEDVIPVQENCTVSDAMCKTILTGPELSECNKVVSVGPYIRACMEDLCLCDTPENSSCLCQTVAEYSRHCSHAGEKPMNWRTSDFCPKTCLSKMEYQECDSPCINTCSNPERSQACDDEHCVDGCFCPSGTMLDDINESGCIPQDQCFCTYNNSTYAPGENYVLQCSNCTCTGGHWNCMDFQCPGRCSVEGGCLITTYDSTSYQFHGDCTYVLSKSYGDNNFTVLAEILKCGMSASEVCLKSITVILNGGQTIATIKDDGSVLVNSIYTSIPFVADKIMIMRPSSFYINLQISTYLQIMVQMNPIMQAIMTLDPSFQDQTSGLCGNFNNVQADDFRTISGIVEGTAAAFANTWKIQADCPNVKTIFTDPCALSIEKEKYAQHWCTLLTDTSGPFAACFGVINSDSYYSDCMYTTCNCENSEDCMCAVFSSYVRVCTERGVVLSGWRTNVCNSYMSSCSDSQTYRYLIDSCQPTCRYINEPDVTCSVKFPPVDGCICKEGLYMDDSGNCVTRDACPCYYKGYIVSPGDIFREQGIICTCKQGKLDCMGREHNIPDCTLPMVYFNCSSAAWGATGAECQKSCQTLDMECYRTQCVSGCVCPSDLVSDGKGGCIPEAKCPCLHNEVSYQPGDEIKMGCNNCTCKDRKWSCTDKTCSGVCTLFGDGHYTTFDGRSFTFSGNCEYTLVQDHCGKDGTKSTFRVTTENKPCSTTGATCSKTFKVFLNNTELIFRDKSFEEVKFDSGENASYVIRQMGNYKTMETYNGLIVMWDGKNSISIKLESKFKGKVCGACGNFDGNTVNDFTTRSQSVVEDMFEFVNSWKFSPTCPDAKFTKDPCIANPYRKAWAKKKCSLITSNVFASCHSQVDPIKYYDDCVADACACDTGGDCECFCTVVAAYAQASREKGVCVVWRTPEICPQFCDYYNPSGECEWHYKPCGAPCMKTCRNPDGKCPEDLSGLEGCYPSCPADKPYFAEEEMKCVAQCGCYDDEGHYYMQGERVFSDKNCLSCECTHKGIECIYEHSACRCEYEGRIYKYEDVINHSESGNGMCTNTTCGTDGLVITTVYTCLPTPPPSEQSVVSTIPQSTGPPVTTSKPELTTGTLGTSPLSTTGPTIETSESVFTSSHMTTNATGEPVSTSPPVSATMESSTSATGTTQYLSTTSETEPTSSHLTSTSEVTVPTSTPGNYTTTPATKTSATTATTGCLYENCTWSEWYNVSSPKDGDEKGEFETFKNISDKGHKICETPKQVECRSQRFPNLTIEEVGQRVECSKSSGLSCYNRQQTSGKCDDYMIKIQCCQHVPCGTITTTTQPTPQTGKTSTAVVSTITLSTGTPVTASTPELTTGTLVTSTLSTTGPTIETSESVFTSSHMTTNATGEPVSTSPPVSATMESSTSATGTTQYLSTTSETEPTSSHLTSTSEVTVPTSTPGNYTTTPATKTSATTACTGPDGKSRMPGETWQSNCQECSCDMSSITVTCNPVKCNDQQPETCDKEGFELVKEFPPDDQCCPKLVCKCNPILCNNTAPKCKPGYTVKSVVDDGDCCATFTCEPDKVCIVNSTVYQPGVHIPPNKESCEECDCSYEMDPETHFNLVKCTPITCKTDCPLGYEYTMKPGQCCGECEMVACVIQLKDNTTKIIQVDETWQPPDTNCTHYSCEKVGEHISLVTEKRACATIEPKDCEFGTIVMSEDGCCEKCIQPQVLCGVENSPMLLKQDNCQANVDLTYCKGVCNSSSMYSSKTNMMEHACSCCQELRVRNMTVQLTCPDGTSVPYNYTYVEECGCASTVCVPEQGAQQSAGTLRRRRAVGRK